MGRVTMQLRDAGVLGKVPSAAQELREWELAPLRPFGRGAV